MEEFMTKPHGMTGKVNARQEEQNKSASIHIRSTTAQKKQIEAQASAKGKSVSKYLLDLAKNDANK